MSIFKKAAPEPPAKVEPKGSAYDLDIEADGDDPATAATVVNALYAKYKKNVRAADETHARAARIQRARGLRSRPSQTITTPFFVGGVPASPRPRVPQRRARAPSEGPRDDARSTRRDALEIRDGARGDRSRRRGLSGRCHHRNRIRSFPSRRFFSDRRLRKRNKIRNLRERISASAARITRRCFPSWCSWGSTWPSCSCREARARRTS